MFSNFATGLSPPVVKSTRIRNLIAEQTSAAASSRKTALVKRIQFDDNQFLQLYPSASSSYVLLLLLSPCTLTTKKEQKRKKMREGKDKEKRRKRLKKKKAFVFLFFVFARATKNGE